MLLDHARDLTDLLDQLQKEIDKDNWVAAEEMKKDIAEKWEYAHSLFPVLLDHAEFHDLSITLTRIMALIELEQKNKLIPEIAVARRLIQEVTEQEKLKLENIF